MKSGVSWRGLGLLVLVAGLIAFFALDAVYGQGFRPPLGGQRPPTLPGMPRPPSGPLFEQVYTCSNCGKEVGRGTSILDRPASCPFCGVRFINGGLGGGNPVGGGNPGMVPPNNPVVPPGGNPLTPPGANPPPFQPQQPPVGQPNPPPAFNPPPPQQPEQPPIAAQPAANDNSNTTSSTSPAGFALRLALGIGVLLAALVLVTVAVIFCVNRGSAPAKKKVRRRARRRDDDDEFDDDY